MSALASLARAYERLRDAPALGFSVEKIGFLISLNADGSPTGPPIDLREGEGKKKAPRLMLAPQPAKRTSGIAPNFLWDKTAYVLGVTMGEGKRITEEHTAFIETHRNMLGNSDDEGLRALLRFLEFWRPEYFVRQEWSEEMKDQNIIFALDSERRGPGGSIRCIHDRPAARALWARLRSDGEKSLAACLVSGEHGPIARLHPAIKGVWGAQSSGASLVSFGNLPRLDPKTNQGRAAAADGRGRRCGEGAVRLGQNAARRVRGAQMSRLLAPREMPTEVGRTLCEDLARTRGPQRPGRGVRGRAHMKKLLNSLYVTTEGSSLRKDGENLVVELDGAERARVPLHMLASVVTFGAIYLSPALMQACAGAGITILLLDRAGRFQARIEGPVSGNVLLRRQQYRASDAPDEIVPSIASGKIANQRALLQRSVRDHGDSIPPDRRAAIEAVVARLGTIPQRVSFSNDRADALRGAEGEAAHLYFSVFGDLIRTPDPAITFKGRSRRPPLDPVNALLSFLYTLLTHDCRSAAESVGLDPAVGFLHRDRPGRPSLALDLMEELRPALAERLALSMFNRRQIGATDFSTQENGAVLLGDEGRRTVLSAWQERKKAERRHPFIDETAPLGLVPYLQAQLLARHLRGDLDAYPPWFWK